MKNTDKQINKIQSKIINIENELNRKFEEREEEIHGLTTSILSDSNVLLLGKPGVAKSLLVKSWKDHIQSGNYFEYLLTRSSVPEELIGPVSLSKLKEDIYVKNTTGMLPESNLAFIDEVFKGSSGTINILLPILNERVFFNGGKFQKMDLLSLIGASNELPETQDGLDAIVDRFILKYWVKDVTERGNFINMMETYLNGEEKETTKISISEIEKIKEHINSIEVPKDILFSIFEIVSNLKRENIRVSGRTVNNSLRLIQANAFLNEHDVVKEEDLRILQHAYWDEPEQKSKVKSIILEETNPSENELNKLLAKAEDIYEDTKASSSKEEKDETDEAAKVVVTFKKLKQIAEKMSTIRKGMKERDKSTKHASKMIRKVIKYGEEISENDITVDFENLTNL